MENDILIQDVYFHCILITIGIKWKGEVTVDPNDLIEKNKSGLN